MSPVCFQRITIISVVFQRYRDRAEQELEEGKELFQVMVDFLHNLVGEIDLKKYNLFKENTLKDAGDFIDTTYEMEQFLLDKHHDPIADLLIMKELQCNMTSH